MRVESATGIAEAEGNRFAQRAAKAAEEDGRRGG